MSRSFNNFSEFFNHGFDTVIDVRSPSEFEEDHIPGAINLPVLDDDERAQVGTIYVQDSPFKARKLGAALVAKNASTHLQGSLAEREGGWKPLVYCWRGGQRSGSFASILSQIGWRADVIEGGYRSYRRLVVNFLYESEFLPKVFLIDGNIGTAKTDILHAFAARGGQIIDLEGLAHHRGSLFGGYADPQPSQKAFEGALAEKIMQLDPNKPVLVEAESSKIGERLVPPSLWAAMKDAPRLRVAAPLPARANYLTRAYSDLISDRSRLDAVIENLRSFYSSEQIHAWKKMIEWGDYEELAGSLMREHYDPRYRKGSEDCALSVELPDLRAPDIEDAAGQIAIFLGELNSG